MEKELAANRAYKVANKDALADKGREYRAANAERLKPAKSVWSALRRAMMRQAGGRFAKSDVERLLVRQGGKCAVCKCVLGGKYHVDHVQPLAAGGSNDKSNIQVLCAPCNLAKGAKDPILFMQSRGFLL
jgi:5-methylcytosine-specific restriction endonuclease McrA